MDYTVKKDVLHKLKDIAVRVNECQNSLAQIIGELDRLWAILTEEDIKDE